MYLVETLWTMYGREDHNLFPLMRLILPHLDSQRPMYKVKEKQLAKMYVKMLGIPETSSETKARAAPHGPGASSTRPNGRPALPLR